MDEQIITWEKMSEEGPVSLGVARARVPNGWLVAVGTASGSPSVVFVADIGHDWKSDVKGAAPGFLRPRETGA